jgi:hypothetical protein
MRFQIEHNGIKYRAYREHDDCFILLEDGPDCELVDVPLGTDTLIDTNPELHDIVHPIAEDVYLTDHKHDYDIGQAYANGDEIEPEFDEDGHFDEQRDFELIGD